MKQEVLKFPILNEDLETKLDPSRISVAEVMYLLNRLGCIYSVRVALLYKYSGSIKIGEEENHVIVKVQSGKEKFGLVINKKTLKAL